VTSTVELDSPLTVLPGVGPKLAEKLAAMGLNNAQDLLFHLPMRYEDRTHLTPIAQLVPGTSALVQGDVVQLTPLSYRRGAISCLLADGSGTVTLRFFHWGARLGRQMPVGSRLRCFGHVRGGWNGLEMIHPSWTKISADRPPPLKSSLSPVYPTGKGVGQTTMQRLIDLVLAQLSGIPEQRLELVPESLCKSLQLPGLRNALRQAHAPSAGTPVPEGQDDPGPAVRRLAFEELLAHQIAMRQARALTRSRQTPRLAESKNLSRRFLGQLGFSLSAAQQRVCSEISADLDSNHPTMRLIQGDVGCGKTAVAAYAMLQAVANGHQAAIMAPTELLAEQHYNTLLKWFTPLGFKVEWLAGSVRGRKRQAALESIRGAADFICGTHALLQDQVCYRALGLIVIDEQQRFGVAQRLALKNKARNREAAVHQLVMTATPIPRTLAMTAFADLDVSIIDEMPPGRKAVATAALPANRRHHVVERIRESLAEDAQAYWVCPLIESSDQLEAEAATDIAEHLRQCLPGIDIGIAHGRQSSAEKESVMRDFKAGKTRLLVATTVIEVGVDVPRANLMIIENAERLGLAQLHQLRGRVGRGNRGGVCVLLYRPPLGAIARDRLDILRHSNDGFAIAEKDLELRGAGEVFGQRQTGAARLRIADLARDRALLPCVREAADELLKHHPRQTSAIVARWLGDSAHFLEA